MSISKITLFNNSKEESNDNFLFIYNGLIPAHDADVLVFVLVKLFSFFLFFSVFG